MNHQDMALVENRLTPPEKFRGIIASKSKITFLHYFQKNQPALKMIITKRHHILRNHGRNTPKNVTDFQIFEYMYMYLLNILKYFILNYRFQSELF